MACLRGDDGCDQRTSSETGEVAYNGLVDKYEIRRPEADDAAAIHELVAAHDTDVLGRPDATLDDVADQLADPGFDPGRDGWLAHDQDGRLAGWGWVCRKGTSDNVDIEVVAASPDVSDRLWDLVVERSREIAAELGHDRVRVDVGIYRQDTTRRAEAEARGFTPVTSFNRLYTEHGGVRIDFLPGVSLQRGADDDAALTDAHRVYEEGFAEHFGHTLRTCEEWVAAMESSATNDWSQLMVARAQGEPAGMLLGSNMFVSDDNCGYVRHLAVLPRFRGRGIGRFLLGEAFAADEARGRAGTYLHVDANNTTPALGLYLSAGMRLVLVIDVWRGVF
jgi:ribosomal protein S18 acetylase RimI-like enzyme